MECCNKSLLANAAYAHNCLEMPWGRHKDSHHLGLGPDFWFMEMQAMQVANANRLR